MGLTQKEKAVPFDSRLMKIFRKVMKYWKYLLVRDFSLKSYAVSPLQKLFVINYLLNDIFCSKFEQKTILFSLFMVFTRQKNYFQDKQLLTKYKVDNW